MDWLFGEPQLDDMLSDPVIVLTMARDGVDASAVRSLLRAVMRARADRAREARPLPVVAELQPA